MLWLGVLLLSTLAVARWPDRIVADARGVRWTDADGASRFFENENALVVTGAIPWVRQVVCERDGDRFCEQKLKNAGGDAIIAVMYYYTPCVQMKCVAFPATDKIDISFPDFVAEVRVVNPECEISDDPDQVIEDVECKLEDAADFDPSDFILNLRAVDSLSLLWHIK